VHKSGGLVRPLTDGLGHFDEFNTSVHGITATMVASAASLVNARLMAEAWDIIGRGWVSVHDDTSLSVYAPRGKLPGREVGCGDALADRHRSPGVRT